MVAYRCDSLDDFTFSLPVQPVIFWSLDPVRYPFRQRAKPVGTLLRRSKQTVEEERRMGFSHSHNDSIAVLNSVGKEG